jgi:DNA-binding LacI/PurR family transcriptional regulator
METNNQYLYHEIQEILLQYIKTLPPNTRILSRVEMMKKYNVTGITIEKAISALLSQGYLYTIKGSGTYTTNYLDSIKNHMQKKINSNAIAIVMPDVMDDFYTAIIRGAEDVAQKNNLSVILCNTDNDSVKEESYLDNLITYGIKGIVCVPSISNKSNLAAFQKVINHNIPIIFCNRGIDGINVPKIIANNYHSGFLATKHMLHHGYKRIAFIASPNYSIVEQRYHGYLTAMNEANLEVDLNNVRIANDRYDQEQVGYKEGLEMLNRQIRPEAVICFNDRVAKGLYRAAIEMNLSIGKEIAIIGNGDTQICDILPIGLTSIQYPKYKTGFLAVETLLKMFNGEHVSPQHTIITPISLTIRESCGCNKDASHPHN